MMKGRFPPTARARTPVGGDFFFFCLPRGEEYFSSGAFGRAEHRGFAGGGPFSWVSLAECGVHCDVSGTTSVSWPFFLEPGRGRSAAHPQEPPQPLRKAPSPPSPAASALLRGSAEEWSTPGWSLP